MLLGECMKNSSPISDEWNAQFLNMSATSFYAASCLSVDIA